MIKYPRVLVIANNCFSLTNSNGRTLGHLFDGWPKDSLAQFTLGLSEPNFNICQNYYCVTDIEALKSILPFKTQIGVNVTSDRDVDIPNCVAAKASKRTALKMLLRHYVWQFGKWKNKKFLQWIDEFNPEVVMIQSGDVAFMLQIASEIARDRNIPLVFFNTEGHFFFKHNYFAKNWTDFFAFPWYQKIFNQIYEKVINQSKFSIHGNQLLKDDFDDEFHKPSAVIYTSSSLDFIPKVYSTSNPIFSYLGNFEFGRQRALIEVAQVLRELNVSYKLDIYGNASEDIVELFKKIPNINYHGFINYTDVVNVIRRSDILFHVECQDIEFQEVLKYGFSTKIADSISSGSNFILYSSPNIACAQYVQSTKSAWYVQNTKDLKNAVTEILAGSSKQKNIISTARTISEQNHNITQNKLLFKQLLQDVSKR